MYIVYTLLHSFELTIVTPPPFNEKTPYISYGLLLVIFQILHLHVPKLLFHMQWHFDQITMDLELNNTLIIYYHMDTTWSVGLVWTYFTNPDYVVVQGWIHTTSLYPDMINQTGSHIYVKFFQEVGYTPLAIPVITLWL